MKNPYSKIENEIQSWLESKGYDIDYSIGVGRILFNLPQKISDVNLNEFSDEFNCKFVLEEVFFNEFGEKSKFVYSCNPPILNKFKLDVREWLNSRGISFNFLVCSDIIRIECYDELSDQIIDKFEKDFEVKCMRYKISCKLHKFDYYFH